MKLQVYQQVVFEIDFLPFDFGQCLDGLIRTFPNESPTELKGVIAQYYQRHIKKSFNGDHRHELLRPENRRKLLADYERRVQDGQPLGVIRDLAREKRFSAALTAKILLEEWLTAEANGVKPTKPVLREHFREPMFIRDGRLSCEVMHANDSDENYGPVAEFSKHSVGQDFEARLRNQILDLGLEFLDEGEQRERGFDKTPDIKLEVPIAIDGCIVNWIESKALFGDQENHATYLKDQLYSYWNRFGPGMVIYWFGHIEELKLNTRHSGILVADSFPDKDKIVFFDPDRVKVSRASESTSEEQDKETQQEELERLIQEFSVEEEKEEEEDSEEELRDCSEGSDLELTSESSDSVSE